MKKTEDHRTRVGADRREKTRRRLIESALLVFAQRGAGGTVIDEVITHAEVSRGTFYNYFRTNEELLEAVAEEVGNQILQIVDPLLSTQDDPAARVACGVRLTLLVARAHPHLAAFLGRVGAPALGSRSLAIHYVPRDIADGVASGRFSPMHPRLAFDLVTGPVLAAFHTLLRETVPESYPQEMAQAILQSLGMVKASARKAAQTALPPLALPQESLLVHAEARAAQLRQKGRLDAPITAGRRPSLRRRPSSTTSSSLEAARHDERLGHRLDKAEVLSFVARQVEALAARSGRSGEAALGRIPAVHERRVFGGPARMAQMGGRPGPDRRA